MHAGVARGFVSYRNIGLKLRHNQNPYKLVGLINERIYSVTSVCMISSQFTQKSLDMAGASIIELHLVGHGYVAHV